LRPPYTLVGASLALALGRDALAFALAENGLALGQIEISDRRLDRGLGWYIFLRSDDRVWQHYRRILRLSALSLGPFGRPQSFAFLPGSDAPIYKVSHAGGGVMIEVRSFVLIAPVLGRELRLLVLLDVEYLVVDLVQEGFRLCSANVVGRIECSLEPERPDVGAVGLGEGFPVSGPPSSEGGKAAVAVAIDGAARARKLFQGTGTIGSALARD
jgi:hypothetical protein